MNEGKGEDKPQVSPVVARVRGRARKERAAYVPTQSERALIDKLKEELVIKGGGGFSAGVATGAGVLYGISRTSGSRPTSLFPRVMFVFSLGALCGGYFLVRSVSTFLDDLVLLDHKANPLSMRAKSMLREEFRWNQEKADENTIEVIRKPGEGPPPGLPGSGAPSQQ